jgi:nucleotide-binding universal stress UspA family protein
VNEDDVPQDGIGTYGGRRKLFYAVGRDGAYVAVPSSGWEAEAIATGAALAEIERHKRDAWERATAGTTSPLEYHMRCRRMDVALLAAATGFSRWRVRRHFRPEVFRRLGDRVLTRYSDALGIDAGRLKLLTPCP